MATNLPSGGTYQGSVGGKQRYNDPTGAVWEQQEFDVGKPTYRQDWTKIQEGNASAQSSVAIAERPGYAEEARKAAEGLDTDFTMDEETAAREEVRKAKQAQIDAVNKIYDELLTEEQQTGTDRMGRTKAIASRAGILESPMGSSQITGTEKFNAQQQKLLQAEREAKIIGIEDKMNTRLDEKLKAERELASTNYDKYLGYLKEVATEAKTDATSLAKTGITLEQLKNQTAPDGQKTYYDQLKEETGMDDFQFSLWYDAQTPEPTIIDTKFVSTADGKTKAITIRRGIDGKITANEEILDIALPTEAGGWKSSFAPDGTLLLIPDKIDPSKSLDDQVKIYGKEGQFNKPEEQTTEQKDAKRVKNANATINSKMGSDKKISWETYSQMAQDWIAQGGTIGDFKVSFPPETLMDKGNQDALPTSLKASGSSDTKWEAEKEIWKQLNSADMVNQPDDVKLNYIKAQGFDPADFNL